MTITDPFDSLLKALQGADDTTEESGVRIDRSRRQRTGAPEVIYGQGKSADQIVAAASRLVAIEGRALVARIDPNLVGRIVSELRAVGIESRHDPIGRTLLITVPAAKRPSTGGRVAILTAGSSDLPHAIEAETILIEMGCDTLIRFDMGIAGLHRLVQPLRETLEFDPDAIIVAAGMDGVLPGVVSGLVAIPVVALPTSTGYGIGGEGIGAMTTMLQACSPGIAVVNIDNGIGAGVMAGLIANRAAAQRSTGS